MKQEQVNKVSHMEEEIKLLMQPNTEIQEFQKMHKDMANMRKEGKKEGYREEIEGEERDRRERKEQKKNEKNEI
ncbi:uncharacterized [Lates japonicus]